jgi:hypothetical protein
VLVADPVANKVGLGAASETRLMWAVDGESVAKHSARDAAFRGGPGSRYPDGTVFQIVTLVDDATLMLGGNFTCNVTTP